MTAQEYIRQQLNNLSKQITYEEVSPEKLEEAILAKVMSKKFRKIKADETAVKITKQAIHHSIINKKPIIINFIFGGNKLWRFEEAPEIDWAELFTTIYLSNWLKYIASVYKPGVHLEFYSEDVVLEAMNNLPPEETDQYSITFMQMLSWLDQYLPTGVSIGYKRYLDEYPSREEFLLELEEAKQKVFKELGNKLPVLDDRKKMATEMNVRLRPGQEKDPLWREKAELIHKSIERTPTMERYIGDTTMIPASATHFDGCIATGSTKKSYAKFWVGVGALEQKNDSFNEIVLTPRQLETADFSWEEACFVGLKGKNFRRIRVLK